MLSQSHSSTSLGDFIYSSRVTLRCAFPSRFKWIVRRPGRALLSLIPNSHIAMLYNKNLFYARALSIKAQQGGSAVDHARPRTHIYAASERARALLRGNQSGSGKLEMRAGREKMTEDFDKKESEGFLSIFFSFSMTVVIHHQ